MKREDGKGAMQGRMESDRHESVNEGRGLAGLMLSELDKQLYIYKATFARFGGHKKVQMLR